MPDVLCSVHSKITWIRLPFLAMMNVLFSPRAGVPTQMACKGKAGVRFLQTVLRRKTKKFVGVLVLPAAETRFVPSIFARLLGTKGKAS